MFVYNNATAGKVAICSSYIVTPLLERLLDVRIT
jgi:hypothetical protein